MNRYLAKIEDQLLRKEASLGLAALAHGAQSAVTNRLLGNKAFGRSVGTHATAGFFQKAVPKSKARELTKGIISPESSILQREAYHLGGKFRSELTSRGINPDSLSKRDMVNIRRMTRGDFGKLSDKHLSSPVANAFLDTASKSKHVPAGMKDILSIKDPFKRKAALSELEATWKKKSNPLTSNIASNLTKPSKDVSKFKAGHGRDSTLEMMVSNVGVAAADPFTAGVNATKTFLGSDTASKLPGVTTAKKKVMNTLVSKPADKAYARGLEGKGLVAGGALNKVVSNTMNPLTGQATRLGNEVGQIVRKYRD